MIIQKLTEKFREAMAWRHVKKAGLNHYWENTRSGDRMAVEEKGSFLGIHFKLGFTPLDKNWLSEAKGRAIIWGAKGKKIFEHDQLHKLRSVPLSLPRNARSAVNIPKPDAQ